MVSPATTVAPSPGVLALASDQDGVWAVVVQDAAQVPPAVAGAALLRRVAPRAPALTWAV